MNPFAHVHLPCSHIPELLLPVHCLSKLQNPPTGTVSEIINDDKEYIYEGKKKLAGLKVKIILLTIILFTKNRTKHLKVYSS